MKKPMKPESMKMEKSELKYMVKGKAPKGLVQKERKEMKAESKAGRKC